MSKINTAEKFWSRIRVGSSDVCWLWEGAVDRAGYGSTSMGGKRWAAHRLAYTLAVGAIPPGAGYHGTVVMHRCDNPGCCNPRHLQIGSNADNLRDMATKGRSTKGRATSCGFSRLSAAQVLAIRSDNRVQRLIAEDYPVGEEAIRKIKAGLTWATVR